MKRAIGILSLIMITMVLMITFVNDREELSGEYGVTVLPTSTVIKSIAIPSTEPTPKKVESTAYVSTMKVEATADPLRGVSIRDNNWKVSQEKRRDWWQLLNTEIYVQNNTGNDISYMRFIVDYGVGNGSETVTGECKAGKMVQIKYPAKSSKNKFETITITLVEVEIEGNRYQTSRRISLRP